MPGLDGVAGEVDEDLFDPAIGPRVHTRDARLVERALADGTEGACLAGQVDGGELHADQLLACARNVDRARWRRPCRIAAGWSRAFIGVDPRESPCGQ